MSQMHGTWTDTLKQEQTALRYLQNLYEERKAQLERERELSDKLADALNLQVPSWRAKGCWCPLSHGIVEQGHSVQCREAKAALARHAAARGIAPNPKQRSNQEQSGGNGDEGRAGVDSRSRDEA